MRHLNAMFITYESENKNNINNINYKINVSWTCASVSADKIQTTRYSFPSVTRRELQIVLNACTIVRGMMKHVLTTKNRFSEL